ncbi:MAG: hypothetical protein NTV86_04820 [Planctomycetota bacterium]|nr:hypothetical protein [Planctomycetota bacterium]
MTGTPQVYRVVGVHRETAKDTELLVTAVSEANAKVKAELQGVAVTSVEEKIDVPTLTTADLAKEDAKRLGGKARSPQRYMTAEYASRLQKRETDWAAIVAAASGILSLLVVPILLAPVCLIFSLISYYRLQESPELSGGRLCATGAICGVLSIAWLLYLFTVCQRRRENA